MIGLAVVTFAVSSPSFSDENEPDQTSVVGPAVHRGDTVVLDGSPAPLAAAQEQVVAEVPVVTSEGIVLASTLDEFASSTHLIVTPTEALGRSQRTSVLQPLGSGPCNPATGADNPHVSGGEVSAHGWWRNGTCTGTKATVRTCLLQWWKGSDGSMRWVTKKCVDKKVKAAKKGTRKPSVTARVACTSQHYTGWANLVDVDVDGTWDNSEDGYQTQNIWCRRVP